LSSAAFGLIWVDQLTLRLNGQTVAVLGDLRSATSGHAIGREIALPTTGFNVQAL
jgi:hypothetical protein